MDERLAKLKTPESCEQFALNVEKMGLLDLALAARRLAVELRAAQHGATSDAEREALQAVYAYERVLTLKRRKNTRASRTWQMIERRGIIDAVEQVVCRSADSQGYAALVEMGMQDMAFEAVVLRHPDVFTEDAVQKAKDRLQHLPSHS